MDTIELYKLEDECIKKLNAGKSIYIHQRRWWTETYSQPFYVVYHYYSKVNCVVNGEEVRRVCRKCLSDLHVKEEFMFGFTFNADMKIISKKEAERLVALGNI